MNENKRLIDLIAEGSADDINKAFASAIDAKVRTVLNIRRLETASRVFNQVQEDIETGIDSERIVESKNILKALSDEVITFLLYLVHDKSHVMGNTYKDSHMEKVFALVKSETFNKPLYRGLYSETLDDFTVGEITVMDRYQSFSEHESIAKQFSKQGLILKATKSKGGFNYGGFLIDYYNDLKSRDPRDYNMEDGDFQIEGAKEEAEHIFPIGAKFKVTAIKGNLIEGMIV
jgi:hypothetical protein